MKKKFLKLSALSLTTFILSTNLNTAKAQLNFAPAVNYGTDLNPEFVISADFNGDGKKDLAVTRTVVGGGVSILIGNGDGTFASFVSYNVGGYPYSISSQDFDGDGDMDLVTANWAANNASVLKNNGNGTFAPAVNYAVSGGPISVCSADFDGDGDYDFAVARSTSNNIAVFFNNGSGVFSLNNSYAISNTPENIIASDVDGDGDKDLVTANGTSNNISVLLNSGNGTFGLANHYGVGAYPKAIFSTDFNADGFMDLATANNNSNDVSVLLGTATGTFSAPINYGVGTNPNSIFSTDFNGDGKFDLATANIANNNISVLLGSGTGNFATALSYTIGASPFSLFSADFNGDSRMDLVTSNGSSNNVSVLLNLPLAGAALNFDGVNDHVTVPYNSAFDFGLNDFTIETWAKTTSTTGNQVMIGRISTNNYWFGVSGGKAYFSITGINLSGTSIIADGNWHHIAAVRKNGIQYIYVDAALEGTQNSTASGTFAGDLTIGKFGGGFNFAGSLDEIRIWNRALCQGEILNNMNGELTLPQTNLAAYYKFNQGIDNSNNSTVTTLNDLSVNANNGTLNFFALSGTNSNWVAPGAVTSGSNVAAFVSPTISVIGANVICSGNTTTLTANGANTYTWSGGPNIADYAVAPTSNTTYSVVGTAINGCVSNMATTSITVNASPVILSQSGNVTLCGDVSSTHSVSVAGTNTYEWYYTEIGGSDDGVINGSYTEINYTTNMMTIQQVLTGDYNGYGVYCIITNSNNCSVTSLIDTIVANPTPIVTVNSGTICAGQSFTMIPSGADTYSYSGGSDVVTPSANATYTVTGTDAATGCENTTNSSVIVNALPSLITTTTNTLLCTGETATLSVMGASTYTWSTTENTTDIVVTPTVQTTYTVDGTDANGCQNTTTIQQNVSLCTGINQIVSSTNNVSVYPNPSTGIFVVAGFETGTKIEVVNVIGEVVSRNITTDTKTNIDISNESTGVYFIKTTNGFTYKIVKQN